MFLEKTADEISAMTEKEQAHYLIEFQRNETQKAAQKLTEVENKLKISEDKQIEGEKNLKALSDVVASLNITTKKAKRKTIEEAYAEKSNDLKELENRRQNGFVKLIDLPKVTKAVGNMTFAGNVTGVPAAQFEPGINDLASNTFILRKYANVGSTTSNTVYYTEKRARDGGAGKQTEGSAKAQMDFDIVVSSATASTYAGWIKVSKQMINDVPFLASEINGELMYEVGLTEESAIYTYLGTVAGTMDNAGIQDKFAAGTSNKYDQILAALTQIRLNMKGKAKPNIIALNPADIFLMKAATRTATTNEYLVPSWVTESGLMIGGVPVVEFDGIAAGTFLVGDLTKLNIRDLEGLTISQGFDADDFTKNMTTILAENRFAMFVKGNDVESIIIDTFANAKAWIEAAA